MKKTFIYLVIAMLLFSFIPYQSNVVVAEGNLEKSIDYEEQEGIVLAEVKGEEVEFFAELNVEKPSLLIPDDTEVTILIPKADEKELSNDEESEYAFIRYEFVEEVEGSEEEQEIVVEGYVHHDFLFSTKEAAEYREAREKEAEVEEDIEEVENTEDQEINEEDTSVEEDGSVEEDAEVEDNTDADEEVEGKDEDKQEKADEEEGQDKEIENNVDKEKASVVEDKEEKIDNKDNEIDTEEVKDKQSDQQVMKSKINSTFSTLSVKVTESKTSKLGHFRSGNIKVYETLNGKSFTAGDNLKNKVYYIKKQAAVGKETFYLLSTQPSAVNGLVGWVNAKDLSTHPHVGVDKNKKMFAINGKGKATTKAWGGSKDTVYADLSKYKNQVIEVNLTEKVGNNIWYRGILAGKQVWVHSSYVNEPVESKTSRLGHLRSGNVKVYETLNGKSFTAGDNLKNKVYYIKKQAAVGKQTFYLLSTQPSAVNGLVGWVNAKDLSTHPHVGVDKNKKMFAINGKGKATTKAWGGSKDTVYADLSKYKNQVIEVNLTEKVGNNIWYRGMLAGKQVWVHSSYVNEPVESKTSRLGHLRSGNVKVYETLNGKSYTASDNLKNKVYYIKKQAAVGKQTFYLLSTQPSAVNGLVGWVNAKDLSTHPHVGVDKNKKVFAINGKGKATTKAWGGSKDTVYADLSKYKNQVIEVNLTEKVGNNIWYRGILAGKQVWVHSSYVNDTNSGSGGRIYDYSNYNITLNEAYNKQVTKNSVSSPIMTDKYRNETGYVSGSYLRLTGNAKVFSNTANVRESASDTGKLFTTLKKGDVISIIGSVENGSPFNGSTLWYEISISNKKYYIHSSLITGKNARSTAIVNVRKGKGTQFQTYAQLNERQSVEVVNYNPNDTWHEISSTWLRPLEADIKAYLDPTKNDEFQHLRLDTSVNVTASELNKLLVGKGILANKGQAFINAAKKENVNEAYLIAHALLETGNGTSDLANGVEVGLNSSKKPTVVTSSNKNNLTDIKKVYNMFGIGAIDGNALNSGAIYAYNNGWFSVDSAVSGGARFIGRQYIHHEDKQNTLYKMLWNPSSPGTHQYASDIAWATKQISRIKNLYNELNNPTLHFDIVKYK